MRRLDEKQQIFKVNGQYLYYPCSDSFIITFGVCQGGTTNYSGSDDSCADNSETNYSGANHSGANDSETDYPRTATDR